MNGRIAPLVSTLSVAAFVGALIVTTRRVGRETASSAPADGSVDVGEARGGPDGGCAEPVGWRVGDVDPRFGRTTAAVEAAAIEAVAIWEDAAGRRLFERDSSGGVSIRLLYDDRQARTEERRRAEGALRGEREAIAARGAALARDRDALLDDRAAHAERRRAVAAGGSDTEALDAVLRDLVARERTLRASEAALRERVGALRRETDRLQRAFPPVVAESGGYVQAVGTDAGGRATLRPEIRVFRFESPADLAHVLAHELGHALGLGHVDEPDALMSAERVEPRPPAVHHADLRALHALCARAGAR